MGKVNEGWLDERCKDGMPVAHTKAFGYPEMNEMTVTEYGPTQGVETLPQWDVPDKVFISCAPVGAFISKRQNPNHPIQPDEIRSEIEGAVEAGASSVHVHARDPETGINTLSCDLYHEVLNPVLEEHPETVVDGTTIPFSEEDWDEIDQILEDEIFDISPLNPLAAYYGDMVLYEPPDELLVRTKALQKHGVKPSIAVSTDADVHTAIRYLIDTDVLSEPYTWVILPSLSGGSYTPNPTAMFDALSFQVERIRDIPGQHEIFVSAAGRASSYLATAAILLGCHVRVGTEDTIYKNPHKDEKIQSNAAEVERFTEIANLLGREVGTPNELRTALGIE